MLDVVEMRDRLERFESGARARAGSSGLMVRVIFLPSVKILTGRCSHLHKRLIRRNDWGIRSTFRLKSSCVFLL